LRAAVGYTSSQKQQHAPRDDPYDIAVQRATERAKSGARMRAGTQRATRSKIDVPTQSATLMKLGYPLAMLSIWVFNYFVFMQ
jgi:hypothetical protein